jgi:hypothetical protein
MKKLKDILSEAYAWERKPGRPLPTLAEVQAEYLRNEAADAVKAKVAKLEKEIADLKHQYYSVTNLSPEREMQLRKQLGEKGRELKRAKREERSGAEGYKGNPLKKEPKDRSNAKPDFLDLDKDGNTEEPMKDAAHDMNEADEPRWQDSDGDGKWYELGQDVNESASFQERFAEYSDDALRDMIVTLKRFDGTTDDVRELERELDRRKHDKNHITESTMITKAGVQAMRELPLEQRILQNLHGHDYILRESFRK